MPGSVQQDLIAAKRVPDPFKGTNEAAIQWVGLTDWQYPPRVRRRRPAMLARDHLDLVFDGLDTFATVSVNGTGAARPPTTRIGAGACDAKPVLKVGRNEVLVTIASPIRTLQPMVLAREEPAARRI